MIGTLVQLRLPPEECDELKEAGKAAGRSLPAEIRHRLNAYRTGAGTARALGDLVAIIAARAERDLPRSGDTTRDRMALLGVVKNAVSWTLDNLGADTSQDTGEFPISKGVSWNLILNVRAPEPSPAASDLGLDTPEKQTLRRIGRALGLAPDQPTLKPTTPRTRKEKG